MRDSSDGWICERKSVNISRPQFVYTCSRMGLYEVRMLRLFHDDSYDGEIRSLILCQHHRDGLTMGMGFTRRPGREDEKKKLEQNVIRAKL
jgi:hypothetical protein